MIYYCSLFTVLLNNFFILYTNVIPFIMYMHSRLLCWPWWYFRTTACTNMNDVSSRSHAIFTIMFTQVSRSLSLSQPCYKIYYETFCMQCMYPNPVKVLNINVQIRHLWILQCLPILWKNLRKILLYGLQTLHNSYNLFHKNSAISTISLSYG